MKPKYNRSKFRRMNFGASLATVITVCFSGSASGADTFWNGTTTDWTTGANWSLGHTPDRNLGENAIVNTLTNSPVVTGGFGASTPQDVFVGLGGSNSGRLDITAGTAANAGGNWMFIGVEGGTGTLAITGSGSLNDSGRLWIGGSQNGGGGTGTLTVNTTGTLTTNDFAVGSSGGTGVATISAGTVNTNGWNFIGKRESGDNGNGTLNLSGGTMTNNGDRTFIGLGNSTGTFNISGGTYNNTNGGNNRFFAIGVNNNGNATTPVVNVTGGTLNVARRLSAGGMDGGNDNNDGNFIGSGKGSLIVNGAGALVNATAEIWAGQGAGSVGSITLNAGTIQTDSWVAIGRGGGNGTLTMTGGAFNKTGGGVFIIGDNSVGVFNISGGTYTGNDQIWVGQGGGGNGTVTMSGGSVTNNSWVAIGRDGGTGTVNMTGGTWSKTDGGTAFIVGASGPGTFTQSNGLVNIIAGETWIGEGGNGEYFLSSSGELRAGLVQVARNGGSNSKLHLDGGTLRAARIIGGGGTDEVDFNGTQIYATSAQTAFISDVDTALIQAGGLKINTDVYTVSSAQVLTGTGDVTKSGSGRLTLTGASSYSGTSAVNEGTLVISTKATGTGDVTVANGAVFGVVQSTVNGVLTKANVTMGTTGDSKLEVNLGNFVNPTANSVLNVTNTLTLNGTVLVNILDQLPEAVSIPIITYAAKSGPGHFELGTVPNGVTATLYDDEAGTVYLNVTSVALPYWTGATDNVWDVLTTSNWTDLVSGNPETFANGNPVLFDDFATGPGGTSIQLDVTVSPGGMTFNNNSLAYSINGSGHINGTSGLLKQGPGTLTLGTLNGYTGATVLEAGTTTINSIADAGSDSAIGAAAVSPANLVIQSATLNYGGINATSNRGFTVAGANATIFTNADISFGGQVVSTGTSSLIKTGTGNLTLSNIGANVIGTAGPGLKVDGGTLTFSGSGSQTNAISGDLWIGSTPNVSGAVNITSSTVTVANWIALGRGNGAGAVSSLTATNSTIQTNDFSTGYDNGLAANNSIQNVTLTNTTWTNNGMTNLAESHDSVSNMTIEGSSVYNAGTQFRIGMGPNSVGSVTIKGSGQLNKTGGWMAVGNSSNGSGTLTVMENGTFTGNNDFNVGDVDTSSGIVNLQDSGTINATGTAFVGKNGGTNGVVNQTGGTFNLANGPLYIGTNGGSTGVYNISAGTLNQSATGQILFISREGTGTMNVSGTANVISLGNAVHLSDVTGGNGTLNLDGGTFTCRRIYAGFGGVGTGTLNFNGGLLKAGTGAVTDFIGLIDTVTVKAGGAFIDSNGNTISTDLPLLDGTGGGGLTKSGAGTLRLNGTNTYTGTTTVAAGSLGGTGSVAGSLVVSASGTIAPGVATGTFTAGATTIAGSYACEINGATADKLVVNGALDVSAATLNITQLNPATTAVYIIASYTGSTPAAFATVTGLPSGYSVNYNYLGANQIAVVRPLTAYESWAGSFGLDPLVDGAPGVDKDNDGQSNGIEFALGGSPISGGNNAKIYTLQEDGSVDGDSDAELLMTIAVRNGTPVNCGTSWTQDGTTYTVQGSADLVTAFAQGLVTQVDPVTTGLVSPPTGYTYRTFSLNGSSGLPDKGFLRVSVAP